MLLLPNSCFLHIPKTGGSWVKQAIKSAGIAAEEFAINGNAHVFLRDCPRPELFKFAFVRNPLHLYRSYWQYKMTMNWTPKNALDRACETDNFAEFIRMVTSKFPGIYSQSLNDYLGTPDNEINFIGRYENLVEDLIRALELAGEKFDEAAIRSLEAVNVSDKRRAPAEYTTELEALVRESEAPAFARFAYQ